MNAPNLRYLSRFRSILTEFGADPPLGQSPVVPVELVNDSRYRGSRERAPVARHWGTLAAGAAGHNNGLRIDGLDSANPTCLVMIHTIATSGTCTYALVPRSTLTLDAENPITPVCRDLDPELTPRLFEIDIQTANIPAGAAGTGVSGAFPQTNIATQPVQPSGCIWWENTNATSLFVIFNTAATALQFTLQWQVMRIS